MRRLGERTFDSGHVVPKNYVTHMKVFEHKIFFYASRYVKTRPLGSMGFAFRKFVDGSRCSASGLEDSQISSMHQEDIFVMPISWQLQDGAAGNVESDGETSPQ